jgi:transposase-like protein
MRLVIDSMSDLVCPACSASLRVESSWECDGEPYPEQVVRCPNCNKQLKVSQYVVTELEEVK